MLGKILSGRYKLLQPLGSGGFGRTFLAEDLHLPDQFRCVVKQLKPQSMETDVLEVARHLFDREATVLHALGKHEQIPQLLAHFEEDHEFYLVQELVSGQDLSKIITPKQPLDQAFALDLLCGILPVLQFVHDQGVIHRDIKPSNLIRRDRDGKMVLIDFGAVKQISLRPQATQGQTTLTVAIGSPGYMPNEQFSGKPRFCSDLYALGMTVIQALTGIAPHHVPEDAKTGEVIWRNLAQVTPQLAEILDRMVCYDFRQRYQTATEVLAALAPLRSASEPTVAYAGVGSAEPMVAGQSYGQSPDSGIRSGTSSELESVAARSSKLPTMRAIVEGIATTVIKPLQQRQGLATAGLAAIALTVTGGVAYSQWAVAQQDKSVLDGAVSFKQQANYAACMHQARSISAGSRVYQQAQAVIQDCQFSHAKSLAKQGSLQAALAQIVQVPAGSAFDPAIKTAITDWSEQLTALAKKEYEQGNLDKAIALIKAIPANTAAGKAAQTTLATWQREWQKNETHVKTAEQALKQKNWQQALDETKKVAKTPFWNGKIAAIIKTAQANLGLAASPSVSAPAGNDFTPPADNSPPVAASDYGSSAQPSGSYQPPPVNSAPVAPAYAPSELEPVSDPVPAPVYEPIPLAPEPPSGSCPAGPGTC